MATFGIIIDIAVVAVFIIFSLIGLKKGFLRSVLAILSWGLCLIVAIFAAKYVAGWLNGLYNFSGLIGKQISKSLIKSNEFFAQAVNIYEAGGKDSLIHSIPNNVNGIIAQITKAVFSSSNVNMSSTNTIGSVVGASLGHISMLVISGILVFVVLKVATSLLSKLFKNIEQTKILGGLNKILGLILGFLKATLIIGTINIVLIAITLVPVENKLITPLIQENTHVEKVVYKGTNKLFEKYVIEGDLIQNFVEDQWQKNKT